MLIKNLAIITVLISLLVLAGCSGNTPDYSIEVSGTIESVYSHNTTVTIDGKSETWQYGTVIILEDGTSYRILGVHEFEIGDPCDINLEPFEGDWYLLK